METTGDGCSPGSEVNSCEFTNRVRRPGRPHCINDLRLRNGPHGVAANEDLVLPISRAHADVRFTCLTRSTGDAAHDRDPQRVRESFECRLNGRGEALQVHLQPPTLCSHTRRRVGGKRLPSSDPGRLDAAVGPAPISKDKLLERTVAAAFSVGHVFSPRTASQPGGRLKHLPGEYTSGTGSPQEMSLGSGRTIRSQFGSRISPLSSAAYSCRQPWCRA